MYNKRKKTQKKKIIILVLILVFLIVGIVVNVTNRNRELTFVEKAFKDGVFFVEKIVQAPFNFVRDKINENKEKKEMYEKYKELETKVEQIDSLEALNDELKKQIDSLKEELNIDKTLVEFKELNATIINRNLDFWYEEITIDKGSNNGVVVNMPVVVNKGLVGKVVQTSLFTSRVQLLTTEKRNDKISIKINVKGKYIYGILVGYDKEKEVYLIEGISNTLDIPKNSLVTTTGMGDVFPSGILIGKVVGVTTDSYDLTKIVEVKSDIDFNDLNYVSVLRRNVQWL